MGELRLGWPVWIGVVVDDLEAQRRFYRETLGLREQGAGEDWIGFGLGPGMLELLARDPGAPEYAQRRYQVGFAVDDIRAAARELDARGVERVGDVAGGPESGQYWCYFRDPEGNVFEVVQQVER